MNITAQSPGTGRGDPLRAADAPASGASGGPPGKFASQDFDILLRSFCADLSPPQVSAMLFGHFAVDE